MDEETLKGYARHIILDHAKDVEGLSIHEMADDYFGQMTDLSNEDFRRVDALIRKATVTVTWE